MNTNLFVQAANLGPMMQKNVKWVKCNELVLMHCTLKNEPQCRI